MEAWKGIKVVLRRCIYTKRGPIYQQPCYLFIYLFILYILLYIYIYPEALYPVANIKHFAKKNVSYFPLYVFKAGLLKSLLEDNCFNV